jgi:hypothetical protein
MLKSNPPTAFGIFKPIGHTLIAFSDKTGLDVGKAKLNEAGFAAQALVEYTAQEMLAQVEFELTDLNPISTFGYELDLIRAHGDLAKVGCLFLIVEAKTDTLSALVAEIVKAIKPVSAQHYGRFMIEDLTEVVPGQVVE